MHHVGQRQDAFIDAYGEHVLPQLRGGVPAGATSGTTVDAGVGAGVGGPR